MQERELTGLQTGEGVGGQWSMTEPRLLRPPPQLPNDDPRSLPIIIAIIISIWSELLAAVAEGNDSSSSEGVVVLDQRRGWWRWRSSRFLLLLLHGGMEPMHCLRRDDSIFFPPCFLC